VKKFLWLLALLLLVIAGCKLVPKRPSKPVPRPPLPPGLKLNSKAKLGPTGISQTAPSYVPTDFALTSVKAKAGEVVLTWINGVPPFQAQSRPDVLSPWTDFGQSTSLRSLTNPAPYGFTRAFFRVKSLAVTPGQLNFVRQSSAGASGNARGFKCATDSLGNLIMVGMFGGVVEFGSAGPGSAVISSSGTLDDNAFIAKYDVSGRVLWAKGIGSTKSDQARAVAVDAQGNIIVGGHFTGDVDFGTKLDGTHVRLVSGGTLGTDAFVAKYDAANPPNVIWAQKFGSANPSADRCSALVVDGANIFMSAVIDAAGADFGGIILNTAGLDDVAVAKLSGATGATLWAKRWGGSNQDRPNGIAADRSGDVWITGTFAGTTDLGSGPISAAPAANRIFLSRYSGTDGSYRNGSVRTMGNTSFNSGNGVTVSPSGNVFITGACVGAVDFGGGLVLNAGGTQGNASFLAAYGATGNYLWAKVLGDGFTSGAAFGSAVASDGTSAYVSGYSQINMLTDGGWLNGHGYYVMSFSEAGGFRWGKFSSGGPSEGAGVALDSFGHVTTVGYASGLVNFGPGPDGQPVVGTTPNGVPSSFAAQYTK